MNTPLSIDSEIGRAVRAALIDAHLLVPEAPQRHAHTPSSRGLTLDAQAFEAVALEICDVHERAVLQEIADGLPEGSGVRAALLGLLALAPAELRARLDRHCARSSRRERHERPGTHERREPEPGYESRGMRAA
jgi:hypothetical protein